MNTNSQEENGTGACVKCGCQVSVDAVRCPHCGYEPDELKKKFGLGPRVGRCTNCSEEIFTTEKTCPECGYSRPLWVRATGHLLVLVGVLIMFTIVGIPIGLGMVMIGQVIKYPISWESSVRKSAKTVVKK